MAIEDYVPRSILSLRTEANLSIVNPWFEKSLSIPGHVAEIGCYRGTMSLKFAFWLRALPIDLHKYVFALDTFEGFQVEDRSPGGTVRIGDYGDHPESFGELLKWEKLLPLVMLKGDAREKQSVILGPLSFVWLDLDIDALLDPVLDAIWDRLTPSTIIGLDDYGRPECPTVRPWADSFERAKGWRKIEEYPEHIAFYQKINE